MASKDESSGPSSLFQRMTNLFSETGGLPECEGDSNFQSGCPPGQVTVSDMSLRDGLNGVLAAFPEVGLLALQSGQRVTPAVLGCHTRDSIRDGYDSDLAV